MTQNTEQRARTREEVEIELHRHLTHGVRGPNAAWEVVHRIFDEVRAYGEEDQHRKNAELRELIKSTELQLCNVHAWMSMKRLGKAKNIMSNVRRSLRAALKCEEKV